MDLSSLISSLITIGIFVFGSGYLYERFIRGRLSKSEEERQRNRDQTKSNTELLDLMQKEMDSMKLLLDKHTEDLDVSNKKVLVLQTQVEEKDKKLREYVEIFQGRNPQTEAFMKLMTDAVTAIQLQMPGIQQYMATTSAVLAKLQKNSMES